MSSTRDEFYLDLFTTAIEGGINYWAYTDKYHWMIGPTAVDVEEPSRPDYRGFYADITEEDPDDGDGKHRIDRQVITAGYGLATTTYRDRIFWSSGEPPPLVVTDDTDWDFDAGDADVIVQLGLFGKVIYG